MNPIEYLLTKVGEEASEIGQTSAKAQQFGLQGVVPGMGITNAQLLVKELNDLEAVVQMLKEQMVLEGMGDLEGLRAPLALAAKVDKVQRYAEFSRAEGCLVGSLPWPRFTNS